MVNPFLYSLLSKRFRRGFHDLIRNTKIRLLNFPIVVRISFQPPTSRGTKDSDKRIAQLAELPSIHTSSQQGGECLINNMCCSGTVIKKTVYRWKTNSRMIQDARASVYISPELTSRPNNCREERDIIEMQEIPESIVLIQHSSLKSTDEFDKSKGSVATLKKKNVTLRFAQDIVNDQFCKSEGDAGTRTNNSFYALNGDKGYKYQHIRIVSEGNSQLMTNDECLQRDKFKSRSHAYENMLPKLQQTVSTAFKNDNVSKSIE